MDIWLIQNIQKDVLLKQKKEKNWQNLWFFHVILKIKNCKLCVKISNSYQKVLRLYLKVAYIILLHHYVVGVTINLFF